MITNYSKHLPPGQYIGTHYDANGNPQYKRVGPSAAQPAALADLNSAGVNIIFEMEGQSQVLYKNRAGEEMIGTEHKLNKNVVTTKLRADLLINDTIINVFSTKELPPFGQAELLGTKEIISWTNISSTALLGVVRGVNSTVPVEHKKGATLKFNGESYTSITRYQANQLFEKDILENINAVRKYVKVPINKNQASALICLARNLGTETFATCTVVAALNRGDYILAKSEFFRYVYTLPQKVLGINGPENAAVTVHAGLRKRRAMESDLFSTPVSTL